MKNKIVILFSLIVLSFGFTSISNAATLFADNFNSYTSGSVCGQGDWGCNNGSAFTVENSVVNEGANAVKGNSGYMLKEGTALADGSMTIYGYANANGGYYIHLLEGSSIKIWIDVNADVQGKIAYANLVSPYFHPTEDTIVDKWYYIQIQWRSADHMFRYNVNGNAWTSWLTPYDTWTTGIDTVKLFNVSNVYGTGGLQYFDTIQENPISNKTPVLIVPGLMGTEMENGSELLWPNIIKMFTDGDDSFMDPLAFDKNLSPINGNLTIGNMVGSPGGEHFYDLIVDEFKSQNYIENENLFTFPYDWRYGVSGKYADGKTNIDLLNQKIQDILTQTGGDKVDVVAHSQGGLIVKKYVANHLTNHHIGKAVFVGVPNTGALKAIKVLLQGDSFDISFRGFPFLSPDEIKKISENMPAAYDLLPTQQYYDTKGSFVKVIDEGDFLNPFDTTQIDLNYQEFGNFLTSDHSFNSQALTNAENLHTADFDNFDLRTAGIDLYAIDGCKTGTLNSIVENRHKNVFGESFFDEKLVSFKTGDGTVPIESATNLPINQEKKFYALSGEHSKLLSQDGSRQQIVNIISGSNLEVKPTLVTQDIDKCQLNGKAISVYSPVDIFVTDQDGNHLGIADDGSIKNEIPNAAFEILGDPFGSFNTTQDKHKFLYLPTDSGQTYTINIKGTGAGTFTIASQNITNSQATNTEVFPNIPVTTDLTGQINLGTQTTLTIKETPTSAGQTLFPSSTISGSQLQDFAPPVSVVIVNGKTYTAGQYIGQYKKEVTITFKATDTILPGHENETSGVLNLTYNLDNAGVKKVVGDTTNIKVLKEGSHTLSIFSTDNAGNNELIKTITFTIKKG